MNNSLLLEQLKKGVLLGDIGEVSKLCKEAIEANIPTQKVLKAMEHGMQQVGEKYEAGEYFLTDMLVAAEAMKSGFKILEPAIQESKANFTATVVIGSVLGDIHDVGKNIVVALLRSAGFNVIDLGVDVSPETFVLKAKEQDAKVIAASAYTSTTMQELRKVVEEVADAGLRDHVVILVGGAPTTQTFATNIGADGWAVDAPSAVHVSKRLLAELTRKKKGGK